MKINFKKRYILRLKMEVSSNNIDKDISVGSPQITFLFALTVIYTVFISLLTFTKDNLSFLSQVYINGISQKSAYKDTLYASCGYGYFLTVLLFSLLLIVMNRGTSKIAGSYNLLLTFFIVSTLILLTLSFLSGWLSYHEKVFTKGVKNLEYNYPFYINVLYSIFFIILAFWYISDLKNYKMVKNV
jgi:hypothetical protein